jgi:hypothetical protein
MTFDRFWIIYEQRHGSQPLALRDFARTLFDLGRVSAIPKMTRVNEDEKFIGGTWLNTEPPKVSD